MLAKGSRARGGVDMRDANGRTALMTAAQNGHNDCVALPHRAGAKVDATDGDGHTPLLWSVLLPAKARMAPCDFAV